MQCAKLEDLQIGVGKICYGNWEQKSFNHHQFIDESGLVINYYDTTGTVDFQGKPGSVALERKFIIETLLSKFKDISSVDDKSINQTIIRATSFYRNEFSQL